MRLWTLHPRYLDAQGLVALWREGLLARAVLRGRTRGYRHHPQLERFRARPRAALNAYLRVVLHEARSRGYTFDATKIGPGRSHLTLTATRGQLAYEWRHLMSKLRSRSPELYERWRHLARPKPHPLFRLVPGSIESWERPRARARRQR